MSLITLLWITSWSFQSQAQWHSAAYVQSQAANTSKKFRSCSISHCSRYQYSGDSIIETIAPVGMPQETVKPSTLVAKTGRGVSCAACIAALSLAPMPSPAPVLWIQHQSCIQLVNGDLDEGAFFFTWESHIKSLLRAALRCFTSSIFWSPGILGVF